MTLRHTARTRAALAFAALAVMWLAWGTAPASAQDRKGAAETADVAEVRKLLSARLPGANVGHVAKSPYFGLYEALLDQQMIYTDAKVTYVFVGNVIDARTLTNLTEERVRDLTAVAFNELPLDQSIKVVRGKGTRKLVVFSDADCPFCKRLENELQTMDDITVYVLLYPIDELHPDAARKSKMVWCSSDRTKAWLDLMLKNVVPSASPDCETPLPKLKDLARKHRVVATPTLVFADGRVIPGALPKARLEAELAKSEANLKAK